MKRYYLPLLVVFLTMAGCESPEDPVPPLEGRTVLTAQIPPLKIARPDGTPIESTDPQHIWSERMHLGAFDANGRENVKYTLFSEYDGEIEGRFYGPQLIGNVYAYYPFDEAVTADGAKLIFPFVEEQTHSSDILEMYRRYNKYHVAVSSDDHLEFGSLYGCLALNIEGDFNVLSVRITSRTNPLAGRVMIDFENGMQADAAAGSSYSLTIDCPQGVTSSADNPAVVYALLPAATYNSLTVEVTTDKEEKIVRELSGEVVVSRMNLDSVQESIAYETVDITFESVPVAKRSWTETDQVTIYSPLRKKTKTVVPGRAVDGLTNIVIAIGASDEPYNVVYPASAVQQLSNMATVVFPSEQTYSEGEIDVQAQIYAGRCQDGQGELYLVSSVLAVNVTASSDCTVEGLSLSSGSMALAGVFEIDMEYADKPVSVEKNGTRAVTMHFDAPVSMSKGETRTFYFAVPAGEYQAEDLTVEVNSSLGVPFAAYSSALTTSRAQITQAPVFEIDVTDLTAGNAYANCFVLPDEEGWYSFAARIKGGYESDEDGNDICTPTSVAGTLFELNSGMISHVKLCDDSSRVSFYYDGSTGNASIATIECGDDEPYKGMVLWAWHLWCPGDGQPKDVVFGSNTYMDRNLGSLHVPESEDEMNAMSDEANLASGGMYYSWGRPSPFPYPNAYTLEAWATRMGEAGNTTTPTYYYPSASLITKASYGAVSNQSKKVCKKFTSVNEVSFTTAAAATKQPLQIGYHANSNDNRYWCRSWLYDAKSDKAPWNYSYEKNRQYDPCPYGYELPVTDVIVKDLNDFYSKHPASAYLVQKDKTFKGGYYIEHDGNFLWHAVSGMRYSYGLWSHVYSHNVNLAGATTDDSLNFLLWWGSSGAGARALVNNSNNWQPAAACAVRCIKK